MTERNISLATENVPVPGQEWVMECKFEVADGQRSARFEGFAASEVVASMLKVMETIAEGEHVGK